ncbi:electron carrier [Zygosaccharomyces mellis]|uniref:Electron carrier n=1 Tax=Zygosaccharomyces mellis TaxID=42258 RepID=A0A4C2EBM2_9SACH|nr:electron carrier [Zygosaccharomyces mellis]
MTSVKYGLVLIHPGATENPSSVVNAQEQARSEGVSVEAQYLINKLNDGSVKLEDNHYDEVRYVTPEAPSEIRFPSKLIGVIGKSLRTNGKLYGLSDLYKIDALINGFEISRSDNYYCWIKKDTMKSEAVAVPLRNQKKMAATTAAKKSLPIFKKASDAGNNKHQQKQQHTPPAHVSMDLEDEDENEGSEDSSGLSDSKSMFFDKSASPVTDNDSIEEDELVDESEMREPTVTMITCGKSKTRRRKACKDCTCGQREIEEQELDGVRKQQDKAVKFSGEELTEIDFTVQGKKVGGCGSCSLGDAFRCSGCPYLGLPAFKPGQQIDLSSMGDDL